MKNIILVTGFILLLFNTLIGLIISAYPTFNVMVADISIILSTALLYVIGNMKLDDGYKIGLSWLFLFTGLARLVCCIALPNYTENNIVLLLIIGVILFELLCTSVCYITANKNDKN